MPGSYAWRQPGINWNIWKQAKENVGVHKPCGDDCDSNNLKYTALQADPEFLAHASLFKKGKKGNRMDEVNNDNEGTTWLKLSWLQRYLLQWKGPSTLRVTVTGTGTVASDEEDNNGDASEDIDINADLDISDIYASKSELLPVDAIDLEIDLGSNCDGPGDE